MIRGVATSAFDARPLGSMDDHLSARHRVVGGRVASLLAVLRLVRSIHLPHRRYLLQRKLGKALVDIFDHADLRRHRLSTALREPP